MQKKIVFKKHIYKVVLLYLVFRILMDIVYLYWVNPIYGYNGFLYEVHISNVSISYLFMIFLVLIIPKNNDRVSNTILQLHFIVMIIPLTSIYAMANLPTKFMIMVFICFVLQIYLVRLLPLIKLKKIKNANIIITVILSLSTIVTYFYLLSTQTINVSAFNISNIYEIRSEINFFGVMSYLVVWQYRIINPVLLIISIMKKNYVMSFAAIGLQVLLYLMEPHKEVILSIGLILIILYLERKQFKLDSSFIKLLSLISMVSIGIYEIYRNVILFSLVPVRLLYIPALIKFQHYEFFLENQKLYYSEGLIGKLLGLNYPYSVPSGFVVSGGGVMLIQDI